MRENRTHGSEGGDGESRFRPLSSETLTGPPIKTFGGVRPWDNVNFFYIRSLLRGSSSFDASRELKTGVPFYDSPIMVCRTIVAI